MCDRVGNDHKFYMERFFNYIRCWWLDDKLKKNENVIEQIWKASPHLIRRYNYDGTQVRGDFLIDLRKIDQSWSS